MKCYNSMTNVLCFNKDEKIQCGEKHKQEMLNEKFLITFFLCFSFISFSAFLHKAFCRVIFQQYPLILGQ